jgi:hypothetical protein
MENNGVGHLDSLIGANHHIGLEHCGIRVVRA